MSRRNLIKNINLCRIVICKCCHKVYLVFPYLSVGGLVHIVNIPVRTARIFRKVKFCSIRRRSVPYIQMQPVVNIIVYKIIYFPFKRRAVITSCLIVGYCRHLKTEILHHFLMSCRSVAQHILVLTVSGIFLISCTATPIHF